MTEPERGNAIEDPRAELSRKLHLLMEVIMAPDGTPATYRMIAEFLAERHIPLSRARWAYMLSGDRHLVADPRLLTGIAQFFDVDPAYLIGPFDGELPRNIETALRFVRADRLSKIRQYAARQLGEITAPEDLESLTALFDDMAKKWDAEP